MRRMITNKQVVDVVNKAIEEGEIQAGGLPEIHEGDAGKVLTVNAGETGPEWAEVNALPEIQEGDAGKLLAVNSGETGVEWVDDNNLKLPESAPAAQQLVGINTSGAQNTVGIGNSLTVDNNELNIHATSDGVSISFTSAKYAKTYTAGAVTALQFDASPQSGHNPVRLGVAYPPQYRNNNWYKLFLDLGLTIAYETYIASVDSNKIYYTIGLYNGTGTDITIPSGNNYSMVFSYC